MLRELENKVSFQEKQILELEEETQELEVKWKE